MGLARRTLAEERLTTKPLKEVAGKMDDLLADPFRMDMPLQRTSNLTNAIEVAAEELTEKSARMLNGFTQAIKCYLGKEGQISPLPLELQFVPPTTTTEDVLKNRITSALTQSLLARLNPKRSRK